MSLLGKRPRPRFPEAEMLGEIFFEEDGLVVRDNTNYLTKMAKTSLFTRPTQLGKSTLFSLAEMVYSKKREKAPSKAAKNIPAEERNAAYVLQFNFLRVTPMKDLRTVDSDVLRCVKRTVQRFVKMNPELVKHYIPPEETDHAGTCLLELADAVKSYADANRTGEFLVVLVDEYDRPLREALFENFDHFKKVTVIDQCPHYRSFFSACRTVAQMHPKNKTWVTGILPIALDLISDFKPKNMTFNGEMLEAVGLRDDDVDFMLQRVDAAEPFADEEERLKVRRAICDHAHHLKFLSSSSLYHTRMVNELMECILVEKHRKEWLKDLSQLPPSVTRERAPSCIYKLLQRNEHSRIIAKDIIANRDIDGLLNVRLNLIEECRAGITRDDYLTLLVHLGVVSVEKNGRRYTFRVTSRYFRTEYLKAMLDVTLAPLFKCETVEEIYEKQELLQEFMEALPLSGMAKLISWAESKTKNRILELQFQGFLLVELHGSFKSLLDDDSPILPTQEDKINSEMRTDIQIKRDKTLLVLELKQKPKKPTENEMAKFHEQLGGYVNKVSEKNPGRLVAGFVVVMYANGRKYYLERYQEEVER